MSRVEDDLPDVELQNALDAQIIAIDAARHRDRGAEGERGPNGSRRRAKPNGNGASHDDPPPWNTEKTSRGVPEIVATFDFLTLEEDIAYQEVHVQFRTPDGGWEQVAPGEPRRVIKRRRPANGAWTWDTKGVTPLLYGFPELHTELMEPETERRIVFLPDTPPQCETLKAWGLMATCNSGGVKHWTKALAAELAGADVVILFDEDDAGRKREQIVGKSLLGVAKRVRALAWVAAAATKEVLLESVEHLTDWKPEPYKSAYGAVPWSEVRFNPKSYEYLIHGVLPANERSMIFGYPTTGKSFIATDMALHVSRGKTYEGRRVRQSGVIYCACEGGKGFVNRVFGHAQYHGFDMNDGTPFVMLTRRFDLFGDDDGLVRLRAEIEHWASTFSFPLGLVVLDTVSASGGAMDDGKGNEVARYLSNGQKLLDGLNCATLFVHHVPKAGDGQRQGSSTPRGSGKWTGDLEATISVGYEPTGLVDEDGRPIRIMRLVKLREGEGNKDIKRFVLRQVEVGRNEYDDAITTCIVSAPGRAAEAPVRAKMYSPSVNEKRVFRALLDALAEKGVPPPRDVGIPTTVEKVITGVELLEYYLKLDMPEEGVDETTRLQTARAALRRSGNSLLSRPEIKVIGKQEVGRSAFYWWTGNPLSGFAETFPKPRVVEPEPQVAGTQDAIPFEDF